LPQSGLNFNPKVLAVLDSTSGLSPEVRADIFLKLCSSSLVTASQRIFLARDAFADAQRVQYRIPHRVASGANTNSEAALDESAFSQQLDELSLKARAIEVLLNVAPQQALDLFEQITQPASERTECDERSIADTGVYYELLSRLISSGHSRHSDVTSLVQMSFRKDPDIPSILGLLQVIRTAIHYAKLPPADIWQYPESEAVEELGSRTAE
jgi:hypothetical protein